MEFVYFLGRFHVLLLHLPIGILFAAIGLDAWRYWKKQTTLADAALLLWAAGALTAIGTVILGWMHSLEGGFDGADVVKHKWLGVSVAVVASAVWASRYFDLQFKWRDRFSAAVVIALVAATGHYGGNITHGDTYLVEYAPGPIKRLAGLSEEDEARPPVADLASADVFLDIVNPAIKLRCQSCHNSAKQRGGLSLASYDAMMSGGDVGAVVKPGAANDSDLYRRITLPESHEDFMPDDGKTPLTEQEVAAIGWWIENGAPERGLIGALDVDEDTAALFSSLLGLGADAPELADVAPLDDARMTQLTERGFMVRSVSQDNGLVDIDASVRGGQWSAEDGAAVCAVAENVNGLNLSRLQLGNADQLLPCDVLPQITSLTISSTNFSDDHAAGLPEMPRLHAFSAHSSAISNAALEALAKYPDLDTAYVWNTNVALQGGDTTKYPFRIDFGAAQQGGGQ